MDNKNRQRNLNLTLIGLATASIVMFTYSNIYQPNFAEKELVEVYIAAEDIPADVPLEKDMVMGVKIDKESHIPGTITNVEGVLGKQLQGSLLKGELLSEGRISDEEKSDGPLIAEIQVPTTIPLKNNDSIRVYVQYKAKDSKVKVQELFHEKKVISRDNINDTTLGQKAVEATESAVGNSSDGNVIYVKLTDKEAMDYQEAVTTGTLYVVKIADVEEKTTLSSGERVSKHDANEESKEDKDSKNTVANYEVKESDDISSIAKKFMTTEAKIAELNDGRTSFDTGDMVNVPGN